MIIYLLKIIRLTLSMFIKIWLVNLKPIFLEEFEQVGPKMVIIKNPFLVFSKKI